jgi:tetratricopeptide (TPR) repeat protein
MEWLLIGLLAFMPFAFGVVEAWSEQIMLSLCAALWLVFAARLALAGQSQIRWHWTYVPILAFLLIAILQWIPLPTAAVQLLSPGTVAARQQLLGDAPDPTRSGAAESQPHLQTMTLSFYRWATGHDLRLVFAIATVFFVVVNEYRRPAQIKRLLAAISITGGAVVLLCLAQDLLGNGKIYWFVPAGNRIAPSGPFVNHSHYAQFVHLAMGAALGWLLILVKEDWQDRKVVASEVAHYLGSFRGKLAVALVVLLVLGATTIFLSLSRGGMISLLIAAALTTMVLSLRRSGSGHNWALVAIALLVFLCVLYLGFDAVYDRLATLEDLPNAQNGRWQILKDIFVAWTRFPVFGTGLGTHAVVYPMFDRSTIGALAGHAENEYAQVAEEMGALGLGTLAVFGILIWATYARVVRNARQPMGFAAYGLGFGLLAILIHSFSDFGQHLPANATLSALFCALLICLDRLTVPETSPRPVAITAHAGRPRYGLMALLVCSLGPWVWVLFQADLSRRAERHWAKASATETQLAEAGWQKLDAAYVDLIAHASRAAHLEPGNIHYRHWLNVYRWRSISRTTDPNGMVLLHDQALQSAGRIVQDLREATLLCPTFGPTWCVLGQLEYNVLGEDRGLDHLRKSVQLSPNDPTVCLVTGWTDIGRGQTQEGLSKLRKAVQLDGRLYPEVARACVHDLRLAQTAMDLAEGQTHRLTQLAGILAEADAQENLVQEIQNRIVDLLTAQCGDSQAPASCFATLGWIHEKRHNADVAVQCFREALARDYGQVNYHLALARLLAHAGEWEEAMREAKVCLRLSPQYGPAEKLIEESSVRLTSPANKADPEETGSQ